MKHHIIVKWNEQVTDKTLIRAQVETLYADAVQIPGVHAAELISNCIDRTNRYDLMIRLTMEKEALPVWDASELHHQWKDQFGELIQSKAIFDCED